MKRLTVLPMLALAACESQEPPSACGSIPQVIVHAGETTTIAACFTDPNGDRLVYSAASSDAGVATASVSDTTVTVTAVAVGSAAVTVTAYDPEGLAASQDFTVTVRYLLERLTDNHRWDRYPAWSPDGTRIAFSSDRDSWGIGDFEIYVMDADGSGQTRLTNSDVEDHSWLPAWSPDGTEIAFVSDRDGGTNGEIYLMNADGGNQTRLTNNDAEDYGPAWSPDGTRIAFVSERDGFGKVEVYVIRIK